MNSKTVSLPLDIRIGILAPITWDIPPTGYGPWEKVVYNLVTSLRDLGYSNVTLFATKRAHIPGVETVAIIEEPLGATHANARDEEARHIKHALEFARDRVDILHNHLNFHPLLLAADFPKPIITTLHGAAIADDAKVVFRQYKDLPYVSISNAERNFLPELNYVKTVYNGIDFSECPQSESEGYLVHAGRIHPTKGTHNAILLAARVGRPLIIAGPIDDRSYFETKVAPFLTKDIRYVGNLSHQETLDLVSKAFAFVALTEWDEPFGLAIAEAMACGVPVIGSNRGSHPELISEGISGILVHDIEDAVEKFPQLKHITRQECRAAAASLFSKELMAQGYLTVYANLLQSIE